MKARVKATGELVEVDECGQAFKDMRMDYMDTKGRYYKSEDLDFNDNTPFDYWTRLEHQYAGMAMQGMLSNTTLITVLFDATKDHDELLKEVIICSHEYAHALVEKYKKEERK